MNSGDADRPLNAKQMTINTAGLLLLFGWACYVLLSWLVYRLFPNDSIAAAAVVGAAYLLAVGALLTYLAVQSLRSGRHLTYRTVIDRQTSPIVFWGLTISMGGIGTTLLGAGFFALVRTVLLR